MTYKVSIIIPCYNLFQSKNGEKYLDNAIKSLQKQSIGFENLEVILIDDCSEDNTKELLIEKSKQYENIIVLLSEEHKGTGYVRNLGVQNVSCDYVMFLDADDEYSTESCERLYNTIVEKNADMVSSNYITRLQGTNYWGFTYDQPYKEFSPEKSLKNFQKQYALWARIFKKKLLKDTPIETNVLEDTSLNYKVFLNSEKVVYLNDFCSCIHNVNYESITMKPSLNSMTNAFDQIPVIINMVKKYSEDDISPICGDLFSMILQDMLIYNFSMKENYQILTKYYKVKEKLTKNLNLSNIMTGKSFLIRFVDFFVKNNQITLISYLIRPIQLILSNKKIFNLLFVKFKKHKEYTGQL